MALDTNLISYWKLDESSGNAADSVGSNTLTNVNTVTYGAGKINNGADLERGSGQYFTINDNASLSITGDISISMWVKPESAPASGEIYRLCTKWDGGGSQKSWSFYYKDTSGTKALHLEVSATGSADAGYSIATDLGTGTWKHIICTWVAATSTAYIYIDGVLVGSGATGTITSLFNSTAAFRLGYIDDPGNEYWDGMIDETGIWSRALIADEVTELYNSGNGIQYPFTSTASGKFFMFLVL